MGSTDIAFCPRLKVKEDIPSFEDRLFANIAILQGRLMCMKNRMIPAVVSSGIEKISPAMKIGHASEDPRFAAGTSVLRRTSGP